MSKPKTSTAATRKTSLMTTRPTIEPSGRRHIRRIQRDSQIVGLTIKNEYGDWVLYDAQQRPMTSRTFKSPKLALDAFLLIEMPSSKDNRSEEHTSELQSLMRISYAVFC